LSYGRAGRTPSTHSRSTSTSLCQIWTRPTRSSPPQAGPCSKTMPDIESMPIPLDTRSASYRDPPRAARGTTVGRLVYDCFSPRSLASFYEGFIGAEKRLEDSPERVVVDLGDDEFPNVAFQHAQFPAPRWQPSLSRTTACGLPVHRRRRTSALPDASRQGRNEACRRAGRNPHSGHRVRRSSGSPILLLDQPRQALSRLPRQPAGFMHVVVIRFRRHPRTPARRVLSPKGSAVAGRQMLCARKRRNLPGCSHGVRRRWNWVSSFS